MKRKSNSRKVRVYRLDEFENFRNYGLETNPPMHLIDKAFKFLREELNKEKYKLHLAFKELDFIANEMSRMALAIQAFVINCSKITPQKGAPVNISLECPEIKFKKNVFVKADFSTIIKAKDKYSKIIDRLDYLNEIDPTLVKNISIKIELNKNLEIEVEKLQSQREINNLSYFEKLKELSKQKKTELRSERLKLQEKLTASPDPEKSKKSNDEFNIPPQLHGETISILTYLVENLTGHIALYSDLNARKDHAENVICNLSIDAILPYLRKHIYPTDKNYNDRKYFKQEEPKG